MRAVIQRVSEASVLVDGDVVAQIGSGFLVLLGVGQADSEADADAFASKLVTLRVFADGDGKMNQSLLDTGGEVLVVSQFTLLGSVRKGRRPSFTAAAPPMHAEPIVDRAAAAIAEFGIAVSTGRFGAMMSVELTNDGPVTIVMDVAGGKVL